MYLCSCGCQICCSQRVEVELNVKIMDKLNYLRLNDWSSLSVPRSVSSPSPVLSSRSQVDGAMNNQLRDIYQSCNNKDKRIFKRIYLAIWHVVGLYRRTVGSLSMFWLIDQMRAQTGLNSTDFVILTYLYFMSDSGLYTIHSAKLKRNKPAHISLSQLNNSLIRLRKVNLIARSHRDTSAPFLSRSISNNQVFIRLTIQGIDLVKQTEKSYTKALYDSTIADITT